MAYTYDYGFDHHVRSFYFMSAAFLSFNKSFELQPDFGSPFICFRGGSYGFIIIIVSTQYPRPLQSDKGSSLIFFRGGSKALGQSR